MADRIPDLPGGPHLRTVAMPRDTNASGAIFGGWTLLQMDLAGGTFAAHQAKGRVATVSIEAMRFLRPVAVGDEVSCYCILEHKGGSLVRARTRRHGPAPRWRRISRRGVVRLAGSAGL